LSMLHRLSVLPDTLLYYINAPPPTNIYTLSLHDALPICHEQVHGSDIPIVAPRRTHSVLDNIRNIGGFPRRAQSVRIVAGFGDRSEEHTSELQSLAYLVCRLLLEKKKQKKNHLPDFHHRE